MREDCKYFQRRTYPSGDVASFCALGLAPEAPWRCPDDCRRYEPLPGGPATAGDGPDAGEHSPISAQAAAILGSAEEIISSLGPELVAEERRAQRARAEAEDKWWNRLKRSPRWPR